MRGENKMSLFVPVNSNQTKLCEKEAEILDYSDKLNLLDTEIQNLKLEIAKLELKKLENIGTRRQASHILGRLKIEHEALKREYFQEIRQHP